MSKIEEGSLIACIVSHISNKQYRSNDLNKVDSPKISNHIYNRLIGIFALSNNMLYIEHFWYSKASSITSVTIRYTNSNICLSYCHQIISTITTHPYFLNSCTKPSFTARSIFKCRLLLIFESFNNISFIFGRNSCK